MMLRAGLIVLTAYHLVLGAWLVLAPRSFYDGVPTVDMFPPFNAHLFNDFGAATLSIAVMLGAAAVILERRLVLVALAATITFAAIHLAFHGAHLAGFTLAAAAFELGALVVLLVLPVALVALVLLRRSDASV